MADGIAKETVMKKIASLKANLDTINNAVRDGANKQAVGKYYAETFGSALRDLHLLMGAYLHGGEVAIENTNSCLSCHGEIPEGRVLFCSEVCALVYNSGREEISKNANSVINEALTRLGK